MIPPMSNSVSLDKLTDDEVSNLGFMTQTTHIRNNISLQLDTDNG